MPISRTLYNEIVSKYKEFGTLHCLHSLVIEFPNVPEMTLESIIHQVFQRRMEKEYWEHRKHGHSYYERYLKAKSEGKIGILLEMSKELDLSPALMAHIILKHHYTLLAEKDNPKMDETQKKALERKIKSHVKNTSLIQDGHLGVEIQKCVVHDLCYGHIGDKVKRSLGEDHERHLKAILNAKGIKYYSEDDLRENGFDKTPDIRLKIPFAVDGKVVNWIESKASFGDEERHKEYVSKQLEDYLKRFGPGMVIYWFGFLEDITESQDKDLLIRDSMPDDIFFMDPDCITSQEWSKLELSD